MQIEAINTALENVMAGTDCGMRIDSRVEWSKLAAMVRGAELATKELFG